MGGLWAFSKKALPKTGFFKNAHQKTTKYSSNFSNKFFNIYKLSIHNFTN
jgi:hypothetical protein